MKFSWRIKGFLLRLVAGRQPRRRIFPSEVKSVLFFRYDKIGDMVVSSPVFRALKVARPDVKICVLASLTNADAIKYNPYVDEIYVYPYGKFFALAQLFFALRQRRFDCVIEFYHSVIWHAIVAVLLVRPRYVVSTHKDGRYGVRGDALTIYDAFSTNPDLRRHLSDIYLETLRPLDVYSKDSKYDFFIGQDEQRFANAFFEGIYSYKNIIINVQGSRDVISFKDDEIASMAMKLLELSSNVNIVLMGMPAIRNRLLLIVERLGVSRVCIAPICPDIVFAGALIKCSDIVITPDTSVVHIASAFNKPLVAVYINNPDLFLHFAPRHSSARVVLCGNDKMFSGYSIDEIVMKASEFI
jgi:ADP-heptose:LPS heptosyltransferase